jgi:hypothetical protein
MRRCEVCRQRFKWTGRHDRAPKACSAECRAELKRRSQGNRRGKANPNHRHGKRVGERDRAGEKRWRAALDDVCVGACATPRGGVRGLYLHHIVYRQKVVREGGDVWDGRNALTICGSCHGKHHTRSRVLPLSVLPSSAFAFAVELLGAGAAYNYLRRRYDGDDPRLDALLG